MAVPARKPVGLRTLLLTFRPPTSKGTIEMVLGDRRIVDW
jgi:hypothetical protein